MSHNRQDTYVSSDWAKHLRPEGKRNYHKAERRRFKDVIDEMIMGEGICGPGTPPKKMSRLKKFGIKESWSEPQRHCNYFQDGYTTWYKTEKARDDAYERKLKDIKRVEEAKKLDGITRYNKIGCIYIIGDTLQKLNR